VIPSFIRQALQNGTLVVHGNGKQTRDYVYVDDEVNAMVAASTAPDVNRSTINVGSGRDTSVHELSKLVIEATGAKPEVVYNAHNEGGPDRMCADISLAKQKLNYDPQISLKTGLRLTLERDPRFKK
jgi:UDP-glucose 4-epimerase